MTPSWMSWPYLQSFAAMFDKALNAPKVYLGLLASANNFPVGMMSSFAKAAPEEVRAMFIELFDESKDVVDRILSFKKKSDDLLEKYGEGAKQHYQYENAISTYLWLRFPDKYYIYKYSEAKSVAEVLNADMKIKKGAYAANLRNFLALYDALCDKLKADDELVKLLRDRIEDGHYPDPQLRTLTIDVGFYISRYFAGASTEAPAEEWWPLDYSPEISVDDWVKLLGDDSVFTSMWRSMRSRRWVALEKRISLNLTGRWWNCKWACSSP